MGFIALLVYLVFVLIRPQEFVPSLAGVPVVKMSLLAAIGFLLFQRGKRFDGPQTGLLLAFAVSVFLSRVFSGWVGGGVIAIQDTIAEAVLPFFVIVNALNTRQKMEWAMMVLVASGIVMVSNGIVQAASPLGMGWAGVPSQAGGRIAYLGIFNDPNDLSMYLVMTFPIAVYLSSNRGMLLRWVFLGAALVMVYGVYLTNSRGGLLGLFALAGFWFFLRYGMGKSIALGIATIPALLFALSKFREIDPDEASAHGRLDAWYQGVLMLLDRPLFGVGHGAYLDYHHLTAHNSFVLVFAELGLFGYFCWVGFLFFCGLGVFSVWHKRYSGTVPAGILDADKVICKALTYSMIGFLVTGFFLSRAYSPIFYIYCGFMIAAFYNAIPDREARRYLSFARNTKLFSALFFGMLAFVYITVKVFI